MSEISYVTHVQTVYLKALERPPFPQCERHWAISAIEGDLPGFPPKENELYLETLPTHIITVPMLHHLLSRYIIAILLLTWTFAVLRRSMPLDSRIRRPAAVLLLLGIITSACLDRLGTCMLGLAAYLALVAFPLDALALLVVLTWAHGGWTITAIGLTVAYATWATSSVKLRHLPTYGTFMASLRPPPSTGSSPPEANSKVSEDRGCLVCWSTEDSQLQLPCHRSHVVCKGCLSRLYAADEYCCPLCRRALFIYKSRRYRHPLRHFIVAGIVATFNFNAIVIALQLYKGCYFTAAVRIVSTLLLAPLGAFLMVKLRNEWTLFNLNIWVLGLLFVLTAYNVRSSATSLRNWDLVTLWDGAVLKGVEVWDTHTVLREQYGPVGKL